MLENIPKEMYGRCPFCPIPELKKREGSNEVISWEECNEKTGQIYENYDCFLEWPDGRTVHMQQSVNITERKELSHTANMDELTGLLNRRAGKADLEEKLRSASRERVPVTVCLSDLNNLKVINDTYGHREGDYALVSVAHIVKRIFVSGRYRISSQRRRIHYRLLRMQSGKTLPEKYRSYRMRWSERRRKKD